MTESKSVYLDYNATTPISNAAVEVIKEALTCAWGNPSSSYNEGKWLDLYMYFAFTSMLHQASMFIKYIRTSRVAALRVTRINSNEIKINKIVIKKNK